MSLPVWVYAVIAGLFTLIVVCSVWSYKSGYKVATKHQETSFSIKICALKNIIEELKGNYDEGYKKGKEDAEKNYPGVTSIKTIQFEEIYKKPEFVKVVLRFPQDMFVDKEEEAMLYVNQEIYGEIAKFLVDSDKVRIEQWEDPRNFERVFVASCYITK